MRRLILNADDFGYEPEVSRGIAEAMRRGIVSSTTMMVNTPSSTEAARMASGLAIGLHLNLARWPSVSDPQRTFDERDAAQLDAAFVERETLAQLDALSSLVGRAATHIDVHKHLHQHPAVLEGLARAAGARDLPVRSINATMRAALRGLGVRTNDWFLGDAGKDAYWTLEQLALQLDALPDDGVVELMCHPGYRPTTIASGYAEQREVELETFTSPDARRLLATRGLRFEAWAGV